MHKYHCLKRLQLSETRFWRLTTAANERHRRPFDQNVRKPHKSASLCSKFRFACLHEDISSNLSVQIAGAS
jgi:hypothetical protein